ncbi:MAG: hypothetical protein QTN59_15780 [Candidatus Electrothrix communis]|nr:MAG: hypothetical protein QTN59_15780 [Candidatus Electrothrix communis]
MLAEHLVKKNSGDWPAMEETFLNCWEVKNCGREPNGRNISLYGVCRVATETNLNGIHNGKNGGRCCWVAIPIPEHHNKANKSGCCSGGLYECIKCNFYKMLHDSKALIVTV